MQPTVLRPGALRKGRGQLHHTAGPKLGAKTALMTTDGCFLDVADGAQFSPISPILDLIDPPYEEAGYLWVKLEVVIEVSYQDLYVDRPRPVYRFEEGKYNLKDTMTTISLCPRARQAGEGRLYQEGEEGRTSTASQSQAGI